MSIVPPCRPVRKFEARTPDPSKHPSRPSFGNVKNQVKIELIDIAEAPRITGVPKFVVMYNNGFRWLGRP